MTNKKPVQAKSFRSMQFESMNRFLFSLDPDDFINLIEGDNGLITIVYYSDYETAKEKADQYDQIRKKRKEGDQ